MLEQFLISKEILVNPWSFKAWVSTGGYSDHLPILLKIEKCGENMPTLLEFNET
jgi:hypothetical protein